jgi:hypothetical protein
MVFGGLATAGDLSIEFFAVSGGAVVAKTLQIN